MNVNSRLQTKHLFGIRLDYIIGGLIVIIGLAITAGSFLVMDFTQPSQASFLIVPAIIIGFGLLVIFTDLAEDALNLWDIIYGVPAKTKLLVRAAMQGKFDHAHIWVVSSLVMMVANVVMIVFFQKWYASWNWGFKMNVLTLSGILALLWLVLGLFFGFIQNQHAAYNRSKALALLLGWIVILILGWSWAEPHNYGDLSRLEQKQLASQNDYWEETKGSDIYYRMAVNLQYIQMPDIDIDDCEGCGWIYVIIGLGLAILGTITCLHFWVLASTSLGIWVLMHAVSEVLSYEPPLSIEY